MSMNLTVDQACSILALQLAGRRAKHTLKAKGYFIQEFTARQLSIFTTLYFEEHREELMAKVRPLALECLRKK